MKKIIIWLLIVLLMFSFASCDKKDTVTDQLKIKRFNVLEAGNGDNISGANHSKEIDLNTKTYQKDKDIETKNITLNNADYEVEYLESREGYLYKNNIDEYRYLDESCLVEVGINNNTQKIDRYAFLSKIYLDNVSKSKLTRDECSDVAKNYFEKTANVTVSEYTLFNEGEWTSVEFSTVYDFSFVRVIDGIETGDSAAISVTAFGDVIMHHFTMIGEMKDATLPSESDIKLIEENVDKKLQDIYSNVTDKYSVSYEIPDPLFIRMADGRYAFEYFVGVDLTPKNDTDHTISEATTLIVYVD